MNVLISGEGIDKHFGVTHALKSVGFEVLRGEVLGLIGENGSGKSTLSSIIAAVHHADAGSLRLRDEAYAPKNRVEASALGVSMISQEKGTFDELSVAHNIFIGQESGFAQNGLVSNRKMRSAAQKALDEIGATHIKATASVQTLNMEDRKLVEIARAVYNNPDLLIVDETTTALSRLGRDMLYRTIESMKKQDKAVIFISHDIDEVMEVCDRLMVLRDGEKISVLEKREYNPSLIRKLMVGREIEDHFYRTDFETSHDSHVVMRLESIYSQAVQNISLQLRRGEILGIGGLTDCGMHEVGKLAYGLEPQDYGTVTVDTGEEREIKQADEAVGAGVAYISKNRDQESLMLSSNIKDNVCLPAYKKLAKNGYIRNKTERRYAGEWLKKMDVKMRDMFQFTSELSGGNKQKIALAKWIGFGANVYIMDCPTRGIDVGVKATIYRLMEDLKAMGKSILLISEELPELIGMCDRVIIMKQGAISGEFQRNEHLNEKDLIEYMI